MFPPGDVKVDAKGAANSAGEHKFDHPKYKFELDSKRNDLELTPSEFFERVAMEDKKQNRRLSSTFGTRRGFKLHQKQNKTTQLRFVVCVLALFGMAISQMSRMIVNQTITQMVETEPKPVGSSSSVALASDGSCPWPVEQVVAEAAVCTTAADPDDNFTPTLESVAEMTTIGDLQATTTSVAESSGVEFDGDIISELLTNGDFQSSPTTTTTTAMATEPDVGDTTEPIGLAPLRKWNQLDSETSPTSSNVTLNRYPQYKWSIKQQNVLLGGFFYSYSIFMVMGGRLAEMYGAKYVLMLAVGGSALINLATPLMADFSFGLLMASRVLMGAIQAGVVPGLYALFAKWLTMTEASIFVPMIKMSLRLGMFMGSSLPGFVSGWPNVFYLTGLLGLGWSLVWLLVATSKPADNGWVSRLELERIERKKRKVVTTTTTTPDGEERQAKRTPWLRILTAPSVLALLIVKLTFNYGIDFISIELPSYLNYVHHTSKEQTSAITSAMYLLQVLLIVFVGWMAKAAVQRRPFGLGKTGVRKLFQGVASFGLSLSFLLLTLNDCKLTYVVVILNVASFASMFGSGGESMLPYDLSDEYPATIMAIANSFANLSAIITTTSAALVLGEEKASFARWNLLLLVVGAVNLVGGLAFTFMVKAEQIDFGPKGGGGGGEKKSDLEANSGQEKPRVKPAQS